MLFFFVVSKLVVIVCLLLYNMNKYVNAASLPVEKHKKHGCLRIAKNILYCRCRIMKNIVLIGMPGAGKSMVGVILAKTLCMEFIDTDILIQQKQGRSLQEIIDCDGIDKFLGIEENTVLELKASGCVIATGGSIIYSERAICHLKKDGILIYLKLPFAEIEKRIKNISKRGIAMSIEQDLAGLYEERVPMYEKNADIVIDCTGKDMEDVVNTIKIMIKIMVPGT